MHTCALMAGGGVKCWGLNSDGQLGIGNANFQISPTDVSGVCNECPLVFALAPPHSTSLPASPRLFPGTTQLASSFAPSTSAEAVLFFLHSCSAPRLPQLDPRSPPQVFLRLSLRSQPGITSHVCSWPGVVSPAGAVTTTASLA
jgi:hypothetical protein